jgi:hypothetical protein
MPIVIDISGFDASDPTPSKYRNKNKFYRTQAGFVKAPPDPMPLKRTRAVETGAPLYFRKYSACSALLPGAVVDRLLLGRTGRHEAPAHGPPIIVVEPLARVGRGGALRMRESFRSLSSMRPPASLSR